VAELVPLAIVAVVTGLVLQAASLKNFPVPEVLERFSVRAGFWFAPEPLLFSVCTVIGEEQMPSTIANAVLVNASLGLTVWLVPAEAVLRKFESPA
jgi:hypothetical protein